MKTRTVLILYLVAVIVLTFAAPVRAWNEYYHRWQGGGRDPIWDMPSAYSVNIPQFLLELGVITLVAGVLWLIARQKAK